MRLITLVIPMALCLALMQHAGGTRRPSVRPGYDLSRCNRRDDKLQ
jgi:hypothetical protein